MQRRIFVVAVTTILLITGMLSSAVCEMTCLPQAQTGLCCARQMQQSHGMQSSDHCQQAPTTSQMTAPQCGHPQESTAIPALDAQAMQLHATDSVLTALPALPHGNSIVGKRDLPVSAFLKRSSIIPLRI